MIDINSQLGKVLAHRPDQEVGKSTAVVWASAVLRAIDIEARLQTAGRVPNHVMRVPSLKGSSLSQLAEAIAAGDLKLAEVKEYLLLKVGGDPPTAGDYH